VVEHLLQHLLVMFAHIVENLWESRRGSSLYFWCCPN
jgi:hypothetical protein